MDMPDDPFDADYTPPNFGDLGTEEQREGMTAFAFHQVASIAARLEGLIASTVWTFAAPPRRRSRRLSLPQASLRLRIFPSESSDKSQ